LAARYDRLLNLVKEIAEDDPLTALHLLQVYGVNRFGHIISAVPPAIIRQFAESKDAAVVHCLEAVHEYEVTEQSTHALPVGARGGSVVTLTGPACGAEAI